MNEKRFVDHDTSIEDYVGIFENKNTRGKIPGNALRNEKSDEREVQTIDPAELNKHLADFIHSVRRKDGEDFESSSLSLKMINKNLNLTMYIIKTIPHGECFVQHLRTRFCIRNFTRSLRSLVRFLIRQQLMRKYRTPALSRKYSL